MKASSVARVAAVAVLISAVVSCTNKAPIENADRQSASSNDGKVTYLDRDCEKSTVDLKVVESGASIVETESSERYLVSFSAVVSNTEAQLVLRSANARLVLLDSKGDAVDNAEEPPGTPLEETWEILSLLAGEKTVITGRAFAREDPADVSVEFEDACFVEADKEEVPFGVVTKAEFSRHADRLTIDLTTESKSAVSFRAVPYLVFRNKAGDIVGGAPWSPAPPAAGWEWFTVKPGTNKEQLELEAVGYVPKSMDLESTEVYFQQAPKT